jgi:hypothetical protein
MKIFPSAVRITQHKMTAHTCFVVICLGIVPTNIGFQGSGASLLSPVFN